MRVFHDDKTIEHVIGDVMDAGRIRKSRDVPDRVAILLEAVLASGHALASVEDFGLAPIAAVHGADYLDFLRTAYAEWSRLENAPPAVFGNVFPIRTDYASYPKSIVGRAGYHMHDQLAPIGPDTWDCAVASANLAVNAAQAVIDGDDVAYALCRPSGHHASRDCGGGATYLNNAAIAAQHLLGKYERIALIDIDVHHGNGTQDIFWRRNDVLFVSLHRDPNDYHPYFYGHAQEIGAEAGAGFTLNLPLPAGCSDDQYLEALAHAIEKIVDVHAEALVVSLGLDAHRDDPSRGLGLTADGFGRIGKQLGELKLPTVLVQEGGYGLSHIASSLRGFLGGFVGSRST